jgi:hypothetical protein
MNEWSQYVEAYVISGCFDRSAATPKMDVPSNVSILAVDN